MPIIADMNAIPDKFSSRDYQAISDDGKAKISKALNLNIGSAMDTETTLGMIFQIATECCKDHFLNNMEVAFYHNYQRNGLDVRSGESSIYMNDTLITSLAQFTFVVIYHSLDFDNPKTDFYCYKQLLYILNEQCNNTYRLPNEDDYIGIIEKYPDVKTFNVACDVYWGMITFLILHELSHIFIGHLKTEKEQTIAEQEQEADKEAYLIFLNMIQNRSRYAELEFLEEYIYLAPMMIIDFFTAVNFVDGTVNENKYFSYHPPHVERKEFLFELFDSWNGELNTEEGNGIYNWYIDVVEKFKSTLFNANEQGLLNTIKRKRERILNEEKIVSFIKKIVDETTETDILSGIVDSKYINELIDSHTCFIVDEAKNDFILMKTETGAAQSFKLTNIIFDLKGMLDTLCELALTSDIPASATHAMKLALFVVYKIFNLSKISFSEIDAQVLLFLHQNNSYVYSVDEEELFAHFINQDYVKKENIAKAIDNLLRIRCIDILNGKITLLEKVYLR